MASKRMRPAAGTAPRKNTPLLFLLLAAVLFSGGYYDCAVLLWGAALVPLLLVSLRRTGTLLLPAGPEALCLYGLFLLHLAALPFAVSRGAALTGALRLGVWVLFFLYAFTYTPEERQDILTVTARAGALLSLLSSAFFLWQRAGGFRDPNGRADGPFGYANTWALFQLVCLLLLLLGKERKKPDWPAMAVLLVGIWLSGSRGTFLLLLALAALLGLRTLVLQKRVLPVLAGLGLLLAAGFLANLASGGMVLDRLAAVSLSSSSLSGRLLYWLDGLDLLKRHPLGTGRGGYLYLQPLFQTGPYILRHIHNEYLQAALDGGVLSGLLLAGLVLCLVLRKGVPFRERLAMTAIGLHAFWDFDLQYSAVVFLLLLCGAGGKARTVTVSRAPVRVAGGLLALVFCWGALGCGLSLLGQDRAAWRMLPADLELAENALNAALSPEEAEQTAGRILASTDLSMVAWDWAYRDALGRDAPLETAKAKLQYLRLNPYREEVYEEITSLLESLRPRCGPGERDALRETARAVLDQMEDVQARTRPLAYRMAEPPELDGFPALAERLHQLTEKG